MEQLRAWLADLVGQMPEFLEFAAGMNFTEAQMASLEAEARFYQNLLMLFDTGSAGSPPSMPSVNEDTVRNIANSIRRSQQREAEFAPFVDRLPPERREDHQRIKAMLQRLGEYVAEYPTMRV
jgi:hypothetical protein